MRWQFDSVAEPDGRAIDAGPGVLCRPTHHSRSGARAGDPRPVDHGVIGHASPRRSGPLELLRDTAARRASAEGKNQDESEMFQPSLQG